MSKGCNRKGSGYKMVKAFKIILNLNDYLGVGGEGASGRRVDFFLLV